MPSRSSASSSTFAVWNGTPMWVRICTTRAENPHCGNIALPFMYSITGLLVMSAWMRSVTGVLIGRSRGVLLGC